MTGIAEKFQCCECERNFKLYQLTPIVQELDGHIRRVCGRCREKYDYSQFVGGNKSEDL